MQTDTFYHIYNRSNGNEKMFRITENYRYFLQQFKKHIVPIADVYAYCLIPNHFHFVLKIKTENELNIFFKTKLLRKRKNQIKSKNLQGFQNLGGLITQQFSNFFNSYTKAFNKQNDRKGSLFSPNFKKKEITAKEYLQQLILYVHLNPVKHQIRENFNNYQYSSYKSILSNKPTLIKRKKVIEIYDDIDNFIFLHQQQKIKTKLINDLILEKEE